MLPDVKVKGSSPRRANRENLPLLIGARLRHNSYDDIDVDYNNFQGETVLYKLYFRMESIKRPVLIEL